MLVAAPETAGYGEAELDKNHQDDRFRVTVRLERARPLDAQRTL
jgi:hypothetical protein